MFYVPCVSISEMLSPFHTSPHWFCMCEALIPPHPVCQLSVHISSLFYTFAFQEPFPASAVKVGGFSVPLASCCSPSPSLSPVILPALPGLSCSRFSPVFWILSVSPHSFCVVNEYNSELWKILNRWIHAVRSAFAYMTESF